MMDLSSWDEYAAIAVGIDWPKAAFTDGTYRKGSGPKLKTINPATGETIAVCGAKDVDLALTKAREAFDRGVWSTVHPAARKDVLIRLAKLMTRNRRELAVMESIVAGKPIRDCEPIDPPEAIACVKWCAKAAEKIHDRPAPAGDDAMAMIVHEPIGVVEAAPSWNFPILMFAWKTGLALAAGCSVIVKPAEQTSMTALRVAEPAAEAGAPREAFRRRQATGWRWANRLGCIPAPTIY